MGWWWKSSSPQKDEPSTSPQPPSLEPNASASSLPSAPPPPPRTLTREEQADAEFNQLLASLEGDINRANASQHQSPSSDSPTDPTSPSSSSPQSPPSIAPDSLYQDTMSCRSAFDYAFFCQSFGGQFVNVYRYGELRSCSEHWENFWLCMKTRTYPEESKKRAIRDHNRKKAIKYRTGPSSQDVWDMRTSPVEGAFQGDFAALEREMKAEEEAIANQKATAAAAV
ncbi:hypothetical protein FE257_009760 [Aspergillus nanangensis]|uniref:Early meiotic induction protein 1 n=1 Tax=Aspergillus nanangensis TaxID=2582783 RepID=A0AAD4GSH9_ASPNN|nr:hypothetical protein FE257_009760 [Aspergillus nanangensis]